jgi:hypothetical protein
VVTSPPDRGAGLISTAAGIVVFLMFLVFAVQLLYGLYASSTVTAVAHDAAQRAATKTAPPLATIEAEARAQLGRVGDEAEFTWGQDDTDADGLPDTVVLRVVAAPPRFVPRSLGDGVGLGPIDRTVRVRIEAPSEPAAP